MHYKMEKILKCIFTLWNSNKILENLHKYFEINIQKQNNILTIQICHNKNCLSKFIKSKMITFRIQSQLKANSNYQ